MIGQPVTGMSSHIRTGTAAQTPAGGSGGNLPQLEKYGGRVRCRCREVAGTEGKVACGLRRGGSCVRRGAGVHYGAVGARAKWVWGGLGVMGSGGTGAGSVWWRVVDGGEGHRWRGAGGMVASGIWYPGNSLALLVLGVGGEPLRVPGVNIIRVSRLGSTFFFG